MGGSVNATGTASGIVSSVSMPSLLLLSFDSAEAAQTNAQNNFSFDCQDRAKTSLWVFILLDRIFVSWEKGVIF